MKLWSVSLVKIIFHHFFNNKKVNGIKLASLGLRETEIRLRATEARGAALLRNLIVRTEDARILGNAISAKTRLSQLRAVNRDLLREHEIGVNNYKDLVLTLRLLNAAVQRAARLRGQEILLNLIILV